MQEYEDAKRSNCFACAGLGYTIEGDEEITAVVVCKCKRGRSLQNAIRSYDWCYQIEHFHDPGFFDGSTGNKTV
jgi:hypothetical protein